MCVLFMFNQWNKTSEREKAKNKKQTFELCQIHNTHTKDQKKKDLFLL